LCTHIASCITINEIINIEYIFVETVATLFIFIAMGPGCD